MKFITLNGGMYYIKWKHGSGHLYRTKYSDGATALVIVNEHGTIEAKPSVNLPESKDLEPNVIFIKSYSENSGMIEALVSAGAVDVIGNMTSGHCEFPIVELADDIPTF